MLEIEHLVRFSILLFFLIISNTPAQSYPEMSVDSLLRAGIEKIILQEYKQAEIIFSKLDINHPSLPLGNIYLAANDIAETVDNAEDFDEEYIDSLLSLASEKTENLLELESDNLWYNYFEALIYGYQSYYSALTGNLISAFADGVLSLRSFQHCLESDNNFNEAFIAYGSYNYWKSAQSKSLLWLPFVKDNREEGIEYLERVVESKTYNRHLAAYSLVWIYIDHEQSRKAIVLAEKMLEKYENSRFFKWGLARAYQDVDKKEAIRVYKEILKSIETNVKRNQFNDIVLKHKIAMLYNELGKYEESIQLCNEILDFDLKSDKIKERLEDRIKRTIELKKSIEN